VRHDEGSRSQARPTVRLGSRSGIGPVRAAILSFLWPGLAHAALRLRRPALVLAVPTLAVAGFWLVLFIVRGPAGFAITLISPTMAWAFMVTFLAVGAWRVIGLVDSVRRVSGPGRGPTGASLVGVAAIGLAIIAPHLVGAWYGWSLYDTWNAIYQPGPITAAGSPAPGASVVEGSLTPSGSIGPVTTPSPSGRFTVLIVGIDSSATRAHALTDTMIVASVDPASGKASMVSVARDIAGFGLYDGGTYKDRINSLLGWSDRRPTRYPDGGLPTLSRELGYLLGVPVPYYASVDLVGFSRMIDAVGGVTITNAKTIDDPAYGGWTDHRPVGFHLSAGAHELDGQTALAYARSRKGAGDNDFTRARRQQQLLVALGRKLSEPAMLGRLPAVLKAAQQTIRTNVPPDQLQQLLDVGRSVQDESIRQIVLGPPYAVRAPDPTRYVLALDQARVRKLSLELFGTDSQFATGG
jgi:polyisoprenyl-teichoic acid--peptidoglycan teichoic acid transferase